MPALTVLGCRRPYKVLAVFFNLKLDTILGSLVDLTSVSLCGYPECGAVKQWEIYPNPEHSSLIPKVFAKQIKAIFHCSRFARAGGAGFENLLMRA